MAAAPPASATISRGPPRDPACDFASLKREAIGLVQLYSGSIWTDYNEHDPGVTLLEQLCYALTELAYRAKLPITDILADPDGSLATAGEVLHRPIRILPNQPVTPIDYRRLLIDRVPDLANLWLDTASEGEPDGLYDIAVYAAPAVPGIFDDAPPNRRVAERARRMFVRHRALCEDVGHCRLLRPVRTVVSGTVAIERSAHPEQVMAELIQRLACYLAPEPRRHSLPELVSQGRSLAEIFEGPLLANGFIDPAELGPRRRQVHCDELGIPLTEVAGVIGVADLRFWSEERCVRQVSIGDDEYFSLDGGLDGEALPLRLTVDGQIRRVDPREVRRRLGRLWGEHRRTYRLMPDLARMFPAPQGRHRDLGQYTPASAQLPSIYGQGSAGVDPEGGAERIAQAKQLAGYLALFDRTMVDFLDRLANVRLLLAEYPLDERRFERPLAEVIPALAPLLIDGGPSTESFDGRQLYPLAQQHRLADFLLGLYGEDPGPLLPVRTDPSGPASSRRALAVKRELLRRLAAAGGGRGRGRDYRTRHPRRHVSGVELRSRIMLGTDTYRERRRRPRLTVVEHVLLRPRTKEGRCIDPAPPGDALWITAVVHLPGEAEPERAYRAQVAAMIRANTPAHVALQTCFVDRDQWVRFRRLHHMWLKALRDDMGEALDCISAELRHRFDRWSREGKNR